MLDEISFSGERRDLTECERTCPALECEDCERPIHTGCARPHGTLEGKVWCAPCEAIATAKFEEAHAIARNIEEATSQVRGATERLAVEQDESKLDEIEGSMQRLLAGIDALTVACLLARSRARRRANGSKLVAV